jgi:predicted phosphoadenosine phosphosulfate sulfurtransferase
MSTLKVYRKQNVLEAAASRVAYVFDNFERIYVSFSGGKDSTVMLHLVMEEAIRRKRTVGILIIDLEAQYQLTMEHVADMLELYKSNSEVFWVCLPMLLRNAVTQFEPRWCCWDHEARPAWVRELPLHVGVKSDPADFPFFSSRMEFEEFMVLFGVWYGGGNDTAAFVGIRCDESLNRFRTIASRTKETFKGQRYTTKVEEGLYNIYPIYDWKTQDIWVYHAKHRDKPHNRLYDMMHLAGLTPHQMRICQPYGDDQRRGLWLYHIVEPESWARVVARVNGANSGALYIEETGNVTGYHRISKPEGHTWQSFCNLLLSSLPEPTQKHYLKKFRDFVRAWAGRGYHDGIPQEAPRVLETKMWAPSWRRLCKVLLRNDWWCKGLGLTQPKSKAYQAYIEMKREQRKQLKEAQDNA